MIKGMVREATLLLALIATSSAVFCQELRQVSQPVQGEFLMKFSVTDPTGTLINEQVILSRVAEELKVRTKMRPRVERTSESQIERGLANIEWEKDESLLYVGYQALETTRQGSKFGQVLGIRAQFKVERTPSDITIRLQPEANANLMEKKLSMILFSLPCPTIDTNAAFADFQQLMDATKTLELKMTTEVKGELESKYPVDSVLGNFERRYPSFSAERTSPRTMEVKKERVVTMTLANQRLPLRVTGYPFREGTKVSYAVNVPFSIIADGSSKDFELVEKVRTEIAAVVNE